jgi:hypothetical protein
MLSKLAKLKLMFEVMESTMLRQHTYMQMLLASRKLETEGASLPWFNFSKFSEYTSPVDQLTVVEKEMLFRNFYSYQRVEAYVNTWYNRHAHLIKAFRTQKGWNESEFYLNLNETVDTPVSLLNAYRDFTLLAFMYQDSRPKFREGLPILNHSPSLNTSLMFIDVYNKTINEGLITHDAPRISESKFKKLSPLFISTPVQLSLKEMINDSINTGRSCDLITRNQSDDNFKRIFGSEFHNFLPDIFKQVIQKAKGYLLPIATSANGRIDPSDFTRDTFNSGITTMKERYLNLIRDNKDLFVGYLLKFLNAGNRNITKQTILNKLATYVHNFNVTFNMNNIINSLYASRYSYSRAFTSKFYNADLGETNNVNSYSYPDTYKPPFTFELDAKGKPHDYVALTIRTFWILDTITYDAFIKFTNKECTYTSITTSKTRVSSHRFAVSNSKHWFQFITDMNEYLNFRSDTKNFLINLHPVALFNASLGYGGWSSCHHYVNMPTTNMRELSSGDNSFPEPHHSYWFGNYQLAQGNSFVIVEPPVVVAEKQWLIPNKVRTIAWVAEDYSSIRMNLPYPTKQSGDIPDEMYLEYTAIREKMANIFKPFVPLTDSQTWLRVSSSNINSTSTADIKNNGVSLYSSAIVLDARGNESDCYRGFNGEYLQSASVLKELVSNSSNSKSTLIHSSDFLPLNNERLLNGCVEEDLAERNEYDYTYTQRGGNGANTYISKYTRNFSNLQNVATDMVTTYSFNKDYLLQLDSGDYISYATYLSNSSQFFFCQDTSMFSTDAYKVFVDKSKNFSYFSKAFTGAVKCSVSNEYFLPALMVGDVSIFESLKQSQVEWSFIFDSFVNRKLVFVHEDTDSLNSFLDNLTSKTNYKWASGKSPNEYHFDTSKAVVYADGVLKLKSVDDLDGFTIVDVKNLVFKL